MAVTSWTDNDSQGVPMDWTNPNMNDPRYIEALVEAYRERAGIVGYGYWDANTYMNALGGNPVTKATILNNILYSLWGDGSAQYSVAMRYTNHVDHNGDWTDLTYANSAPAWTKATLISAIDMPEGASELPTGQASQNWSRSDIIKNQGIFIYKLLNLLKWVRFNLPEEWMTKSISGSNYPPTVPFADRVIEYNAQTRYREYRDNYGGPDWMGEWAEWTTFGGGGYYITSRYIDSLITDQIPMEGVDAYHIQPWNNWNEGSFYDRVVKWECPQYSFPRPPNDVSIMFKLESYIIDEHSVRIYMGDGSDTFRLTPPATFFQVGWSARASRIEAGTYTCFGIKKYNFNFRDW